MTYTAYQKGNALEATISTFGAELLSLTKLEADGSKRNVIWTPDTAYWNRTDPTLFPTIGRSANDSIVVDGTVYPMPKHGLTNNTEWTGHEESLDNATKVCMQITDSEATRQHFPFPFLVRKTYAIDGNTLSIAWDVQSPVDMPFMMGGHPAFALPDFNPDDEVHGYLQFKVDNNANDTQHAKNQQSVIVSNVVLPDGFLHAETETFPLQDDGLLPLTNHTFDCDTLLDIRGLFNEVTVLDKQRRPIATLRHDMPVLAIWSPNGGKAPFVCIEPWCGCCEDMPATAASFAERRFVQQCKANEVWHRAYTIEVH